MCRVAQAHATDVCCLAQPLLRPGRMQAPPMQTPLRSVSATRPVSWSVRRWKRWSLALSVARLLPSQARRWATPW